LLNIKKARLGRNMTQDQVAHILGITVRSYQYIEYGQRRPSYDVILKLQELFCSTIDNLLSDSNDTE
jgi:transcriptional regulator with XRE-family HTH domain